MWGPETILVVDDDRAVLKLIESCLTAWGFQAVTCEGGREALSWLQSHPVPALLLCDVMMPDLGGCALVNLIRADPKWADLPVAFMSGLSEPPPVAHIQFLPKPIGIGLLYALVTSHCDRLKK